MCPQRENRALLSIRFPGLGGNSGLPVDVQRVSALDRTYGVCSVGFRAIGLWQIASLRDPCPLVISRLAVSMPRSLRVDASDISNFASEKSSNCPG
jgi:hypothetical protein